MADSQIRSEHTEEKTQLMHGVFLLVPAYPKPRSDEGRKRG